MNIRFSEWIQEKYRSGKTRFNLDEYEMWEVPNELLIQYLKEFGVKL